MDERQSAAHPGRNIARKFLSLLSKRKRDEEKKRMDLRKAMRDSSVERLAAVIASARMEFGDQLNDLCSDAEGVLQRLLREDRSSGTRRKVTLRERLLLADIEASGYRHQAGTETSGSERNNCSTSEISAEAPMLQAVLTLMRPSTEIQAEGVSGSMSQQSLGNSVPPNTSGRRLLSALLWEERTLVDDSDSQGWVAFGVSVGAPIHFDQSRSQSARGSELNRGAGACHRPSASLDGPVPQTSYPATATTTQTQGPVTSVDVPSSTGTTSISTVPETPMRVSLMSLLRETEDGSGIIFMNRQTIADSASSPTREEAEQMCCVCMGHHKGAAFIPCGHTFCRKCSRELQQARGTCPLCNKEIRDILNLY